VQQIDLCVDLLGTVIDSTLNGKPENDKKPTPQAGYVLLAFPVKGSTLIDPDGETGCRFVTNLTRAQMATLLKLVVATTMADTPVPTPNVPDVGRC
jgi:hypothetical protein